MDNFNYELYAKNRMSWKDFLAKNDFSLKALVKFNNTRILNKSFFKDISFIYRVLVNRKDFYFFLNKLKEPQLYPLAETDDSILFKVLVEPKRALRLLTRKAAYLKYSNADRLMMTPTTSASLRRPGDFV